MPIDRYSRQTIFSGIGPKGQEKLAQGACVIIGCGALGTVVAQVLVRAGVGLVRIVDRDFVEYHNLQRQVLFDENDIREQIPKAIAAERHLKTVNSSIKIEGIVADVNYTNIEDFLSGADVVVDGLDNVETRLLINDACLKHKIPWVYGGAISSMGMTATIIPGETPCFRCLHPFPIPSGHIWTCDTAGVLAPAPFVIGSLQAMEAVKILVGSAEVNRKLLIVDVWRNEFNSYSFARRPDCPACSGKYEFLDGKWGVQTTKLCGQNSVQIVSSKAGKLSLAELAGRLSRLGNVTFNEFMLTFIIDSQEMVVFPDGRAIVKNTNDISIARALYAKYIGM